jgi:hypothetical protein
VRIPLAALLILPLAALAGPYDQPWVIITTDTTPSADPLVRPVNVSRVDEDNVARGRALTEPGLRRVTVDLPPRKGFSLGTQEILELQASPCMRYYLAARLETETGQHWKAFVRRSETIGECLTKFKGGAERK